MDADPASKYMLHFSITNYKNNTTRSSLFAVPIVLLV